MEDGETEKVSSADFVATCVALESDDTDAVILEIELIDEEPLTTVLTLSRGVIDGEDDAHAVVLRVVVDVKEPVATPETVAVTRPLADCVKKEDEENVADVLAV